MAVPLKITPFDYTSFFNDLDRNGMEKVNSASSCQKTASQEGCQRYTYRVLQTIQMKLILLCVWAEPVVLGSTKTALKFK
jgi:hypothetical protein